ncbi:hypothetical protein Q7P35_001413 [Cladosporium inversicolor]
MGAFNTGHCVQRREKPTGDWRARVARCKTWRIVDDGQLGDTHSESLAQKGSPASEVKVEPRGDGGGAESSTSLLPQLQAPTIPADCVLSMPTVMTNFSSLDPTTAHTLHIPTAPEHFKREQTGKSNMNSLKSQGRKRLKYKEPSTALVLASDATTNTSPQASHPQLTSPTTSPHTSAHSTTHDPSPPMTARITSPLKPTPDAIESATALVPYSSSSAASEHIIKYSPDSAVDMGGNRKPHGRKKKQTHPLTEDDQELVFRGRRSNDTIESSSWRWDPAVGTLVSNTSGASYRPPLAAKASNQKLPVASNPDAASSGSTKLDNSMWAEEIFTKVAQQQTDWTATNDNNDWSHQNDSTIPATGGWDTEHPPYPNKARLDAEASYRENQARKFAKPFNHKGRAKKPRGSPWIKDSLIPKGDPNRHKMRWSSSSESSSFNSNRASSGWGTRRKRDENGAGLADWAGGLGPASIDWDSRSKFRDHQSAAKIENWLNQNLIALEQVDAAKLTNGDRNFPFATTRSGQHEVALTDQGDIAPRYWFVPYLDGKSAKFFWQEHIDPRDDDVKPYDEEDLHGAKPWWDSYVDDKHSMLKLPEYPEEAGIDPYDENSEERHARENDKGAVNAGESRKATEKAKREAQRKRILAKREKARKFSGTHESSWSSAIKPGLNIFLRPATKEDMVQLRDVYNRYIDNAFVVPETERLTEADMLERWYAIRKANLPFIVACQRGEVIKARNMNFNGGEDMIMADKVVGFAYAADWSDGTCIFRPTVKLEVFVHMEQYMKNIGSCLVDKMIRLLDPQFVERGGYDVVGEELERDESARAVSNVLVRYSYEAKKTDKFKWVSKWLKTRYGFEQVADLQGVAEKFDEQYDSSSIISHPKELC